MARQAKDGAFTHPTGMPQVLDQNQQDYATQLNRALSLTARPPAHLDPRIQVGINIDDLTHSEFWWLRKGQIYTNYNSCPAVAGQFTWWQFVPGAGKLTVLEKILIVSSGVQSLQWGFGTAEALGGAFFGSSRDDRGLAASSGGSTRNGNGAAAVAPPGGGTILVANQALEIPGEYVMTSPTRGTSPFNAMKIVSTTVNVAFHVTCVWRERTLLQTEVG